jgi:hypothetical protein
LTRALALAIGVLTLGIGPWLALPASSQALPPSFSSAAERGEAVKGQVLPRASAAPRLTAATGCSCRDVVVEASNVVRDADVRTGDATVVNRTITYIAPSYEDTEVEVEQEAEARSGDAVAGQILAVDGGEGCSRVHVTAKNIVEDADIRSGDATARNRSLVLIDPAIRREDLEIEVDQEAVAESGDAVAGQVIGVQGGGPCGGVILDALNRVRNVDLRTGEATTDNRSDILTCESAGCIADIRRLLRNVDTVDVCTDDGCAAVPKKDFIQMVRDGETEPDEPDDDDDADNDEYDGPTSRENPFDYEVPPVRTAPPWRYPTKTRSPREDREESDPTPTPEPTPF